MSFDTLAAPLRSNAAMRRLHCSALRKAASQPPDGRSPSAHSPVRLALSVSLTVRSAAIPSCIGLSSNVDECAADTRYLKCIARTCPPNLGYATAILTNIDGA